MLRDVPRPLVRVSWVLLWLAAAEASPPWDGRRSHACSYPRGTPAGRPATSPRRHAMAVGEHGGRAWGGTPGGLGPRRTRAVRAPRRVAPADDRYDHRREPQHLRR